MGERNLPGSCLSISNRFIRNRRAKRLVDDQHFHGCVCFNNAAPRRIPCPLCRNGSSPVSLPFPHAERRTASFGHQPEEPLERAEQVGRRPEHWP
jgi:hypothetical protein